MELTASALGVAATEALDAEALGASLVGAGLADAPSFCARVCVRACMRTYAQCGIKYAAWADIQ